MRAWLWSLPLVVSCGISFPLEYRIEDLRVLDVNVDPPEVALIEPGHTATTTEQLFDLVTRHPSTQEVTLTALVAHPDPGAAFSYSWKLCSPVYSDLPCEGERTDITAEDARTIRFAPVTTLIERLFTADREEALATIVGDPRNLLNGIYAHLILRAGVDQARVQVDTQQIDAEKRLVIFDPSLVRVTVAEARRLGMGQMLPMVEGFELPTLCTRATEDDLTAIEAHLASRVPNRSPQLTQLIATTQTASAADVLGRFIAVGKGDQIVLRAVSAPEDRERYRLIDDNCHLIEVRETLSFSWFVTAGDLSAPLTVEGETMREDGLRTIYTAPEELEDSMLPQVRIWVVLRDGRGGSAHGWVDVFVR